MDDVALYKPPWRMDIWYALVMWGPMTPDRRARLNAYVADNVYYRLQLEWAFLRTQSEGG